MENRNRKSLIIEMEEECIGCPQISLVTNRAYAYDQAFYISHQCEHLEFCQSIREHWERVMKRMEADGRQTDLGEQA